MKEFTPFDITRDLTERGFFNIPGVGKLEVKDAAERKGRNVQTGEAITISARKVLKFKPSKTIKDKLNQR